MDRSLVILEEIHMSILILWFRFDAIASVQAHMCVSLTYVKSS